MAIRNTLILILLISLSSCTSDKEKINPFTHFEPPKEPYEIPGVFFKKMQARIDNDELYTIYMERNINNHNDSSVTLILEIPYDGEPLEFYGNMDGNGEIKFSSSVDGYITYIIIDEDQLENYDLNNQNEFETKGLFYNDSTFRLIFYNPKNNKVDTLFFIETKGNLVIYPVHYFTSGYISLEEVPVCDSFNYYLDVNSYIFKGDNAEEINLLINKIITEDKYQDVELYVKNYGESISQEKIILRILNYNKGFLTIRKFYNIYSCGAAHGGYSYEYINYDLINNREIKLTDIFKESSLEEVKNICYKKFKIKYNKTDEDIRQFHEFFLPEAFAIFGNGILFQFNPYDVGSFAEGALTVFLPYREIKRYLNRNDLIRHSLDNYDPF